MKVLLFASGGAAVSALLPDFTSWAAFFTVFSALSAPIYLGPDEVQDVLSHGRNSFGGDGPACFGSFVGKGTGGGGGRSGGTP